MTEMMNNADNKCSRTWTTCVEWTMEWTMDMLCNPADVLIPVDIKRANTI